MSVIDRPRRTASAGHEIEVLDPATGEAIGRIPAWL
jgi:acyl-CoA reductase-like NAD-dependent aldehyde dehydrogenase